MTICWDWKSSGLWLQFMPLGIVVYFLSAFTRMYEEITLLGSGNTASLTSIGSLMMAKVISGNALPLIVPFHLGRLRFWMLMTLPMFTFVLVA
jgi:hypothetical protein